MKSLLKACNAFEWLLSACCIFLIASMALVTFLNIILRNFFAATLIWGTEYTRYAFVWATMLGGAIIVNRGQMAATTFFVDRMPKRLQFIFGLIVEALVLILSGACLYSGWVMTIGTEAQTLSTIAISKAWVYVSIPIGFATIIVFTIKRIMVMLFPPRVEPLKAGETE